MPIINANGIKICYQEDGARGDLPVLLLHGLPEPLIPDIAESLVARRRTINSAGQPMVAQR